jgi:hypothetical protein
LAIAQHLDDEVTVVPFPVPLDRLRPPTQVRSTLVASSMRAIRDRGLFDAYVEALDPRWRNTILESVAGVWLPMDVGLAHYRACDVLSFSVLEQIAIGREVGDRIQGTFMGTMIRTAKGVGANPWMAFPFTPKLYERLFDGGGCRVSKIGPKDAYMELAANPMVSIPYFRNAMRGLWQVAIELFCRRAYLVEAAQTETSYKVKVSWV